MKQTKEYIEDLLERFLDGQTTESEEQLLSDYFRDADAVPEEWQVYKEIFDSFKTDAYDFSEEELDAMLAPADEKPKVMRLLSWASVACVAAIIGLFVWHPWKENPSSETPSIAQIKPIEKVTKDSADVNVEEKLLVAEERTNEMTATIQSNSTLLAKTKTTTQPASAKEITTSELLETISLLIDVGNETITITSLPDNEGYAVRTVSNEGESNSYMLRRCAESSSLELKSQFINF